MTGMKLCAVTAAVLVWTAAFVPVASAAGGGAGQQAPGGACVLGNGAGTIKHVV
jgi:hypothetical protein